LRSNFGKRNLKKKRKKGRERKMGTATVWWRARAISAGVGSDWRLSEARIRKRCISVSTRSSCSSSPLTLILSSMPYEKELAAAKKAATLAARLCQALIHNFSLPSPFS